MCGRLGREPPTTLPLTPVFVFLSEPRVMIGKQTCSQPAKTIVRIARKYLPAGFRFTSVTVNKNSKYGELGRWRAGVAHP